MGSQSDMEQSVRREQERDEATNMQDAKKQQVFDIRYQIEQVLLPTLFYDSSDALEYFLMQDKKNINGLYKYVSFVFDKCKVENPYSENEYRFAFTRLDDWKEDIYCFVLFFPDVEETMTPLCRLACVFASLDSATKLNVLMYYTLEHLASFSGAPVYMLCGKEKDNIESHINFGSINDVSLKNVVVECYKRLKI